jgi:hypothetical protein
MDKRYQVFVSSTYADLKEERQKVIQTLMEMDCIPSGMELFPAMDEEQFLFIKRIIDDCDYYILIIGGRYGSVAEDGISYTEKEYDYAKEKGIKILAFIHEDQDSLIVSKTDKDQELYKKLQLFIEKVKKGRLIRYWETAQDLPGLVSLSLTKTIKTYPAIGWVRATSVGSAELLSEINDLRKENAQLRENIEEVPAATDTNDTFELVDMSQKFTIHGEYKSNNQSAWYDWKIEKTWEEIFAIISPYLLEYPTDNKVKNIFEENFIKLTHLKYSYSNIDDQDFQTIKVQLSAYKLVNIKYSKTTAGSMGLFWSLTDKGYQIMVKQRSIKKEC